MWESSKSQTVATVRISFIMQSRRGRLLRFLKGHKLLRSPTFFKISQNFFQVQLRDITGEDLEEILGNFEKVKSHRKVAKNRPHRMHHILV